MNNDQLKAFTAALAADYDEPPPQQRDTVASTPRRDKYLARLTPIHDRLGASLAKFPPDLIADGLHMDQIWPLVLGRQREKPRAFEVAAALRHLGWKRVRYYSDSEPSTTLWFPPDTPVDAAKAIIKAKKG